MKAILSLIVTAAVSLNAYGQTVQINGAGATFPYPIYSKWFSDYNKLRPNVQINYQSIGSGGGIRQLTNKTVFFGASDGPMTDEQIFATGQRVLHFPTVLGGVVPVFNITGVNAELRFTGPVIADIIMGKITSWNDAAIARLNPGITLPNEAITVVHRSDGSGTTYILVDYLSKVSSEFKRRVGVATSVNWPTGVGAKGNEGVAGLVKQTPGAFGYVELIYALQNGIAYGSVQNQAGQFVKASPASVAAAANAAASAMPRDFRVSITNPPGALSYPIASFTWLLLYEKNADRQRAQVMVEFLKWALTEGQKATEPLGYAPLPPSVVNLELAALQQVR